MGPAANASSGSELADIQADANAFGNKNHETLLNDLDALWTQSSLPRLRGQWSHGLLVLLCQVSSKRSYPLDGAILYTWEKANPNAAQRRNSSERMGQGAENKRRRVSTKPWSEIEGELEYGMIGRRKAVKIKSYIDALASKVHSARALNDWKAHLGWGEDVWETKRWCCAR